MKVQQIIGGKEIKKIGNFRSYVAFADWLDQEPRKRQGTYYIVPTHCTSPASIDKVTFDGVFCLSERRGYI